MKRGRTLLRRLHDTYRNQERGVHPPKPADLYRYAKAFKVCYWWLLPGLGQGPVK